MSHHSRRGWSGPRRHRGYTLLKVDTVEDNAWMSQPDAARRLGVSLARLGMLIANGRMTPVHNPAGRAGVTIASVQTEEAWRANATIRAKIARLLKDTINWF
ncbi:DNA-binding protein [Streptomyces sp. ERV7]|uniref:DNA-binding protein n=1 Tax=Streptomyces sp. ERV7 TaxID=1322334 RepID=UPI0007F4126B|nr:DNA-binding protein [Streptomyces sp. ERV7]OAR26788.1 DNA-binding protein [Streptomyces sp. ERV7]